MSWKQGAFVWTIESWQAISKSTGYKHIDSRVFTLEVDKSYGWLLSFYPCGYYSLFTDYISITICPHMDHAVAEGTIQISLLDHENKKMKSEKTDDSTIIINGSTITFPKFLNKKTEDEIMSQLLKDDKIVLLCEITVKDINTTLVEKSTMNSLMPIPKPCKNLELNMEADKFEKLLEDKSFSDVVFTVEEKEFHLHKLVLANKSPVFAAMFEHDMQENQQNKVEIVDCDSNTFKEFLRFMYTGEVNDIESVASELIVQADKYNIDDLKEKCELALCRIIGLDNVVVWLDLAVNCNTTLLKKKVFEFILSNKKSVVNTPEFQALVKRDLDLMIEVFKAMAN